MANYRARSTDPDDIQEALEQADALPLKIDDLPDSIIERAPEFFESVREKAISIRDSIVRFQSVTGRQRTALDNMEEGVDRWRARLDAE